MSFAPSHPGADSRPPPAAAPTDLLAELAAGLAAGDDLRRLLQRFLEPLMHIAGAAGGAVRVLGPREQRMHLVAGAGLPPQVLEAEREVEADCGACGAALAGGQPVWAHDLSPCAVRNHGHYFGAGCLRVLAVPLQHRGQVLGVINLFFDTGGEPPADVLALIKTAGELLGLALDNARLARENLRAGVLQERQALAADVHDGIGQSLAFVKMRLLLLQDALGAGRGAQAERYLAEAREAVGQAHTSLRRILSEFRTPPDPLGLAHALAGSAEAFRRSSAAVLELRHELPEVLLRPEQEVQVAHVVSEALANVARHAAARHAWVHLSVVAGSQVQVLVQDDGAGFAAGAADASVAQQSSHYGLAIMRERARQLGGALEVDARLGGGTRICLRFPLPATVATTAAAAVPAAAAQVP